MRSLASMTGTGELSGGDTLAGGDRMLGLRLSATAGAPRALPARRGIVSGDIRRRRAQAGGAPVSLMTMTSSSSLVVGYVPAATMRGAYPLLRLRSRVFTVIVGGGCIDFLWTVSRTRRVIPRDLGDFLRMRACA